jgi:formylglycine-generating enzyme
MQYTIKTVYAAVARMLIGFAACGPSGSNSADAGPVDGSVDEPCPSGRGPSMVRVPAPNGTFCIDSTEVSRAQYELFTSEVARKGAAGEAGLARADICQNVTVTPSAECLRGPSVCKANCENHPQVCVEWCAAYAYCKWAGKRLCRGLDKMPIKSFTGAPKDNEWLVACGNGVASDGTLTSRYPHGNSLLEGACHAPSLDSCQLGGCATVPVGSFPGCRGQGPFGGVFDLGGNVAEWTDERDALRPESVRAWGAAAGFPLERGSKTGCEDFVASVDDVSSVPDYIGFRCCAD